MSNQGPIPELAVLFDADCGFCARCAMVLQRLDNRRRLAFLALQRAESVLPRRTRPG